MVVSDQRTGWIEASVKDEQVYLIGFTINGGGVCFHKFFDHITQPVIQPFGDSLGYPALSLRVEYLDGVELREGGDKGYQPLDGSGLLRLVVEPSFQTSLPLLNIQLVLCGSEREELHVELLEGLNSPKQHCIGSYRIHCRSRYLTSIEDMNKVVLSLLLRLIIV